MLPACREFVLNLVLLDGTSDRFRKTIIETMDASKSHTPALPGPFGRDFSDRQAICFYQCIFVEINYVPGASMNGYRTAAI